MNKFEAITGSTAWVAVALLLLAAALEPVEVAPKQSEGAVFAAAASAPRSA